MMPIDLVLVRHGQSEGNAAKRRSEAGDHTAFTQDFLNRHTSSFRLTERGREQARLTGDYLRRTFYDRGVVFDRCVTSEYVRAMETAALLSLPNAEWYRDVYLTERDWGALDSCPENEREEKFGTELQRRQVQPFFWRPPNGESFLQLCMRVCCACALIASSIRCIASAVISASLWCVTARSFVRFRCGSNDSRRNASRS
jgi:NAD+ kinase